MIKYIVATIIYTVLAAYAGMLIGGGITRMHWEEITYECLGELKTAHDKIDRERVQVRELRLEVERMIIDSYAPSDGL